MTEKAKRVEAVSVTTPVGTAKFPNLVSPDPHEKFGGDYKVFLLLNPEDEEHAAFLAQLEELDESMYKEMLKVKGKKALKREHYPVKEDTNADDEETGLMSVTCKSKASFERNGKTIPRKLRFYDAQGTEIKDPALAFGGEVPYNSDIALRLMVTPYEQGGKFGITLRIADVQVVNKATFGPATAEECGFGSYDTGFTADNSGPEAEADSSEPAPF